MTALVLVAVLLAGSWVNLPGSHLAVVWPAAGVAVLWVSRHRGLAARGGVVAAVAVIVAGVAWLTGATGGAAVWAGAASGAAAAITVGATQAMQRGPLALREGIDVWHLAVGAGYGAAVTTLLSPPARLLLDQLVHRAYQPELVTPVAAWLIRDLVGALLVTAVGLRMRQRQERAPRGTVAAPLEAVAIWLSGGVAFCGIFVVLDGVQVAFLALPTAVWAALRLPTRAASAHLLLGAVTVMTGTLLGRGPFAAMPFEAAALTAHLYVVVLTMVVLAISLHRDEREELTTRADVALARASDQQALLEAVHEAVSDGIVVVAADGTTLLRNPAADRLLGPNPRSGEPRSWEGVYSSRHLDGTPVTPSELPLMRALAGQAVIGVDLVLHSPATPSGVVVSIDAQPLPDVPGAAWSRGAVAVFHDVTQRRREAAEAASTRDLLAGVLDGATQQGIFATGPDLRITVFSSGAERLLGWSAAEVVGDTPSRFLRLAEVFDAAERLGLPPGPQVLLHGLAEHGHTTRRWTFVRRDGSVFTAEMTLTQVLDDDGEVVGSVAVFTDVTGQLAAEQRLAAVEEHLRATGDVAAAAPAGGGTLAR